MAGRLHPFSRPKENPSDLSHRLLADLHLMAAKGETPNVQLWAEKWIERIEAAALSVPKEETMMWRADPIMAGYQINGYRIVRGDEDPIARTIVKDEGYDEQAAELIVNALNAYTTPQPGGGWVLVPVAKLREILILLDNVTAATDSEADYLGQAENMLNRLAAPSAKGIAP